MTAWYHRILQLGFLILIIQNIMIPFSVFVETIDLNTPYFLDLIGYTIVALVSLFYFILRKEKDGILSSIFLIFWVVIRAYYQFFVVYNITIEQGSPEFNSQLKSLLSSAGLYLFIGAVLLVLYALFLQLSQGSNSIMVLIFSLVNLVGAGLIFYPFIFMNSSDLTTQLGVATVGLAMKLILVPVLGFFAFLTLLIQMNKIYPTLSDE